MEVVNAVATSTRSNHAFNVPANEYREWSNERSEANASDDNCPDYHNFPLPIVIGYVYVSYYPNIKGTDFLSSSTSIPNPLIRGIL
ncbi:unnamed protein product [Strongylus vulgaris]|uniref:Uncharacterized protein n=1 Tax=Strongylus vulgaris TaxID=40348 RepID=A0A3P7JKQ9_STRVU|nr:unnamed protein product [Strongylus vulgaris]